MGAPQLKLTVNDSGFDAGTSGTNVATYVRAVKPFTGAIWELGEAISADNARNSKRVNEFLVHFARNGCTAANTTAYIRKQQTISSVFRIEERSKERNSRAQHCWPMRRHAVGRRGGIKHIEQHETNTGVQ